MLRASRESQQLCRVRLALRIYWSEFDRHRHLCCDGRRA